MCHRHAPMAGPVLATPAHWTPCAGSPHAQTLHCNRMTCCLFVCLHACVRSSCNDRLHCMQNCMVKMLKHPAVCCQTPQKPSCTNTALQQKDYRDGQVAHSTVRRASHMHVARQGQCATPTCYKGPYAEILTHSNHTTRLHIDNSIAKNAGVGCVPEACSDHQASVRNISMLDTMCWKPHCRAASMTDSIWLSHDTIGISTSKLQLVRHTPC